MKFSVKKAERMAPCASDQKESERGDGDDTKDRETATPSKENRRLATPTKKAQPQKGKKSVGKDRYTTCTATGDGNI